MSHGLSVRPADSLLVERALDFLAGGPADARTLVSHVCQLPRVGDLIAERTAIALLEGHERAARCADGRWRLAAHPEPESSAIAEPSTTTTVTAAAEVRYSPENPSSTTSVPVPRDATVVKEPAARVTEGRAPEAARVVPSFDEWLAARRAADANLVREPEPSRVLPEGRVRPSPAIVPESERRLHVPVRTRATEPAVRVPRPGDDDPLHSLSYVVVDVETTGGNPYSGHRITEIAAVVVRDGKVQEPVFETLVNPERSIPPMITALTNISWDMVRDKPPFRDLCGDVVQALQGHVFVAHNAAFDWKFVTAEIERASGQTMRGRKLCTVRLARRLLPQLPRRSLDWVSRHYGVEISARHRAAGDAVATAHCLVRLLRDARDRGISTWGDLEMLLDARTGAARRRRKSEISLPRSTRDDTSA
jgi:DNA polymerase-3 subunit epsilon